MIVETAQQEIEPPIQVCHLPDTIIFFAFFFLEIWHHSIIKCSSVTFFYSILYFSDCVYF